MEKILKLYLKKDLSDNDLEVIENAIDSGELDTSDIYEDCMDYIYQRLKAEKLNKISLETIWDYTDENLENLLTHEENYQNLKNYLKRENLIS